MSAHDKTQLKCEPSQDSGVKDTDKKVSSGSHLSQSQQQLVSFIINRSFQYSFVKIVFLSLGLLYFYREKLVLCQADVTQNTTLAETQIQKTMEEKKSIVELKNKEETATAKE